MSGQRFADSTGDALGAELCRYRRRPEKDILADLGLSAWRFRYHNAVFVLMSPFLLSIPIALLAGRMGARQPITTDPVWVPILVGWYVSCAGLLAICIYVLPRRAFLALHEKGFIFRSALRYRSIVYAEITQFVVTPNSRGLTLVLVDSTRLYFQNFMLLFPEPVIVQLLERINQKMVAGELQVRRVDRDLKTRFRRGGLLAGLIVYALAIIVPACNPKSREVALKAFGETVCGMPYYLFSPLLCAVLFGPFVYVMVQMMVLQSAQFPTAAGSYHARELRRAWFVVVLGGIYFLALMGVWIAYKSARGI
jgi:hypothetical protein